MSESATPALRVSQLDAEELDEGLIELLNEQKERIKFWLSARLLRWMEDVEPEINLVLKTLFWAMSVRRNGTTLGQAMTDMRYATGNGLTDVQKWQKYGFLIMFVVLPYICDRFGEQIVDRLLPEQRDDRPRAAQIHKILRQLTAVLRAVTLMHFVWFLAKGGYRSISERLLSLSTVHNEQPSFGTIDMSVLNRELLWHGFADVLLFALPLVNLNTLWKLIRRKTQYGPLSQGTTVDRNQIVDLRASDALECAFCTQPAICPQWSTACPHVFCYYCARSAKLSDSECLCPNCDCKIGDLEFVAGATGT